MGVRQLVLILRAHRWLGLAVLGGVVALSLGISALIPKQYSATATVVVDAKNDPLSTSVYSDQDFSGYLGTQVDIAASERVAKRVVAALKLDEVPEFKQRWRKSTDGHGDFEAWLAQILLKKLSVKPSPQSNVIDITIKWPDAKAAATLANTFAQAYIDINVALRVELAKQYAVWFEERSRALRADLKAKQKALSDFENQSGIVVTDERLDIENARLNELSTQLVTIQGERQNSQSRQRQTGGNDDAIPEVLQNPLIVSLKADLSKAEAKQKDLEARLGRSHPDYLSAEAEVNSISAHVARESKQIISSLGDTTRVNERREHDISAALEAQKKRVLELKHQRDEANVLQSDVATAQRNLDAVTQRLAQSNLEGATQQTNIALLTTATEPPTYSTPNYPLVMLLSVALGSFLAIASTLALELSDQRVHTDDEALALIGVPIIGQIRLAAASS